VSARELACGHEFLWTSVCLTRPHQAQRGPGSM